LLCDTPSIYKGRNKNKQIGELQSTIKFEGLAEIARYQSKTFADFP